MERIEYRNVVEKADWPRGEWDNEPDKIQWLDEATGLPCLIVRGPSGSLCGYVGVSAGHPLYGVEYSDCPQGDDCAQRREGETYCDHRPEHFLNAHGGITFTDTCAEISRERWQDFRVKLLARRSEAERYPQGDSARALRDWKEALESYEAFEKRAHARFVCHIAGPGDDDKVWWFGFDCAHAGDFSPAFDKLMRLGEPTGWGEFNTYRNIEYVTEQCRALAKQLRDSR